MPDPTATSRRIRPFSLCTHWWHLADAALRALDELHGLGLVHADIKEDNLCMPFDARLAEKGQIKLRFTELRLIDVTYSLLPNVPLVLPLPLDPLPDSYQARLLQSAIEADEKLGRPDHANRLDWRIDLFSLGSMLERLLDPKPSLGWNNILLAKGMDLIARLKAHDSPESAHFDACRQRPHSNYVSEIRLILSSLPDPIPWAIGKEGEVMETVGGGMPNRVKRKWSLRSWSSIATHLKEASTLGSARQFIVLGFVSGAGIALLLYLFFRTLTR